MRLLKLSLLIAVMASCGLAHAQRADDPIGQRERGIMLFEQGKDGEAVQVLQALVKKYKTEARAWHYLGLALSRKGNTKEARKAHEQSTKSAIAFTQEYMSRAEPDMLRLMVPPLRLMLTDAAESADKYLELSEKPSTSTVEEWRSRAEELRRYLKFGDQTSETVGQISNVNGTGELLDSKSVSTRARITSKPTPEYTEEARHNQTQGTVVLFMMLADDGAAKVIVPLVTLPDGLTGKAIKAARQIRFTPATRNGKPVSQFIRVEYSFSTY